MSVTDKKSEKVVKIGTRAKRKWENVPTHPLWPQGARGDAKKTAAKQPPGGPVGPKGPHKAPQGGPKSPIRPHRGPKGPHRGPKGPHEAHRGPKGPP